MFLHLVSCQLPEILDDLLSKTTRVNILRFVHQDNGLFAWESLSQGRGGKTKIIYKQNPENHHPATGESLSYICEQIFQHQPPTIGQSPLERRNTSLFQNGACEFEEKKIVGKSHMKLIETSHSEMWTGSERTAYSQASFPLPAFEV